MESKILKEGLLSVLRNEMKPAFGITEPAAVALASSKAYQGVGGELEEIKITTNPGLFKTGLSCVVPGTKKTGFAMAAILGAVAGDPSLELEVLKDVDKKSVDKAESLLKKGIVAVAAKKGQVGIYIEAVVRTTKGVGRAVIRDKHTNVVLLEANGKIIYENEGEGEREEGKHFDITGLRVTDMINFAKGILFDDIKFVLNAVEMNKELAQEGFTGQFGMGAGRAMSSFSDEGKITNDLMTSAQILVASACDARLGGANKAAMSIAGSGCHGVTATLPVALMAERMNIGEERLARAIALSFLISIYIKAYSGRLSAFCGCAVTAATGASAGIVYLLGGDDKQIEYAIENMAADVTGLLCDGGNFGCALKTSTGAGAAIRAALLALRGVVIPANSGIVGKNVEETIRNMGKISSPGMVETDRVILNIMGAD